MFHVCDRATSICVWLCKPAAYRENTPDGGSAIWGIFIRLRVLAHSVRDIERRPG